MSLSKFHPPDELNELLAEERKRRKTVALAAGRFRLIHIGHIRCLKGAKKTADILVAALNSTDSPAAAVLDEQERLRILSSFECVDYVTMFNELSLDHLLLTLKPDVFCIGPGSTAVSAAGQETAASYGGKIAVVGGDKIKSSREIIKQIQLHS